MNIDLAVSPEYALPSTQLLLLDFGVSASQMTTRRASRGFGFFAASTASLLLAATSIGVPGAHSADGPPPRYLLAVSWQPAFCETRPDKPECRSQTADRFDAANFSLHGLWLQPARNIYCGVDAHAVELDKTGQWNRLPGFELDHARQSELEKVMPGTRSFLDRHEWIKHGTCYGTDAGEYYTHSLMLMRSLNRSPVRQLFSENNGREITVHAIRATFDQAFGEGAGKRVRVACERDGSRRIITELTIGLAGTIGDNPDLAKLIADSNPTKAGCPSGIVDPVGLQ